MTEYLVVNMQGQVVRRYPDEDRAREERMTDLPRCVCGSLHLTTNPEGCQCFTPEEDEELPDDGETGYSIPYIPPRTNTTAHAAAACAISGATWIREDMCIWTEREDDQ